MATNPENLNQDLNQEAVPTAQESFSAYGPVAKPVDPNAFAGLTDDAQEKATPGASLASLDEAEPIVVPSEKRPLATNMVALANSDPFKPQALVMAEDNLRLAQQLLDAQKETMVRSNLALERQVKTLKGIEAYKKTLTEAGPGMFSPDVVNQIDDVTKTIAQERIDENARTALEYEVVERVQDLLAANDPVQAKLIADLYLPDRRGDAQQIMHDEAVKNMILSQRMEELNAEYGKQGWGEFLSALTISLIPSVSNFKQSGILDDAGVANDVTSFMNWLLTGTSLQSQGDVLWRLPPKEFARVMASDGPVMNSLRDNATVFGATDIGAMISNLGGMTQYTGEDERYWANLWGVADPLTAVPFTKVGGLTKTLTRLGARSTARASLVDAYETILKEGAEAAEKRALPVDEVVEGVELKPGVSSGLEVPVAVDVDTGIYAARQAINDIVEGGVYTPSRFTNEEELANAFEQAAKDRMEEFGQSVKDVHFLETDLGTGTTRLYGNELAESGNRTYSVEVTFGRKSEGGFASESSAKTMATKMGLEDVETIQDTSGQWFFKSRFNIKEEGFLTTGLKTPDRKMGSWGIRSAAQISDVFSHSKATTAGSYLNRMQTEFTKSIRDIFRGVGADKENLDEIIKLGQTKSKWFSDSEFDQLYTRLTGNNPTQKTLDAYRSFRKLSDIDYVIRNDALHIERARKGGESVRFGLGKTGMEIDTDAVIITDPSKKPLGASVFDASEGKWIDDWSEKSMGQYSDDGYVLLKTFDEVGFPNGDSTSAILIRKADLKRRPLRQRVLAYSEGGHRAYEGKWTAKQGRMNSRNQLLHPNTFVIDTNKNAVIQWVDEMERARQAYLTGIVDPTELDKILVSPGTMDGQAFVKAMDEGWIDSKHPIETVFDREKPTVYQNADASASAFLEPDEWDFQSYSRTTGRMYYSKKGEHMLDTNGQHAATVDPWETLNRALGNAARLSSFSSYKTNLLERFKRTYGAGLNLKNVMNTDSLFELARAPIKDDIVKSNPSLASKIKQEQRSVDFILNFETAWEKKYHQLAKGMAEWALGTGGKDSFGQKAHDAVFYLRDKNPVSGMRGLAFDAKLGFFNFGQFLIQTSTALSAALLNPKHGFHGTVGSWPMTLLHLRGWRPNDVDYLAKIGMHKFMGFGTEKEFKDFTKLLNRSGILDVGGTHLQINQYGPSKVFGAAGKFDQVREWGRSAFYAAEQVNRSTAARIAWGELKDAGIKENTAAFRERFIKLTDDYSFNMMRESGASFQKGLTSIPTQFWAYSFRMLDAMLGTRFTAAQKTRLWIGMFAAAGSAGIPAGDYLSELYSNINGGERPGFDSETMENQFMAAMDRGLLDYGLYLGTGADVRYGEKIGTGSLLTDTVKDLFGMGDYGEKSFMETLSGATGSIWLSAGSTMNNIIKYGIAESGKGGYGLTEDELVKLAKEISVFSNTMKAKLFVEKGIYQSKSGNIQYYEEDEEKRRNMVEAFLIAAGMQPGETITIEDRMNYFKEKSEERKDAVKLIRNYRTEAFANPDKYEENMRKINTLIQMIPDDQQRSVLDESRRYEDNKSLYDSLAKQMQEEIDEKALRENLEKQNPEIMKNDLTIEQPLVGR